jgi:hypothetical protein
VLRQDKDPPEQQRLRTPFNSVVTSVHECKELCAEAAETVHFHTCVATSWEYRYSFSTSEQQRQDTCLSFPVHLLCIVIETAQ